MATNINTFSVGAGSHTELGLVVPTGAPVRFKNLGPGVVFLRDWYAANTDAITGGHDGDNGWPLNVGEEVTVPIPAYPVTADTWVPSMNAVTRDSVVAYITVTEAD